MGRRIDLASLAEDPVLEAPVPVLIERHSPTRVLVQDVAPNPLNPREDLGDLSDLESMRTVGQLQPCAVVTREAFVRIHPEQASKIGTAAFVVVVGTRRRTAAQRLGLAELDIRVLDHLAGSREQFYAASITENIDRKNFGVLEEARAVAKLVQESGSGTRTAEILKKSKGWVSQRISLLSLLPELQAHLVAGRLAVREARRIGSLDPDEQIAEWEALQSPPTQQAAEPFTAVNEDDGTDPSSRVKPEQTKAPRLILRPGTTMNQLAEVLREKLAEDELRQLLDELGRRAR
ncbi:MAG: ParB/RepB/Spo0J family partition protein [Angustibacter sp.]